MLPPKLEFYPIDIGKSLKTFRGASLFHCFKYLIANFITACVPFYGNDDSVGKLVFCIYIFVHINNNLFEICNLGMQKISNNS